MWQGSQHLRAMQKEYCGQNKQITAVGYISDSKEIVNTSWSNYQNDGAAGCKLSRRSHLRTAFGANDLPGRWTQVLNVRRSRWLDSHAAGSDEDSAPECVSDTKNRLDCNSHFNSPNDIEDHWEADNESNIELENGGEDAETQGKWDVSAAQTVPGLIR